MQSTGRKVRKTINIDAEKVKRVQRYLGLETESEVVDHMLDAFDAGRELAQVLKTASKSWKTFRSPLAARR